LSFDSVGTPSESAHVLRRLFPFLIEIDASGRIDMVGARWREIAP